MSTLAWHFVGDTLRDGSPVPPDGEWLIHDGLVKMCRSGLHSSRLVLDALRYAPGDTCCRVEVRDVVDEGRDKLVCRRRKIMWRVDAESVLRDFARRCALDVIDQWDAPEVVRQYLETGDEELRHEARSAESAVQSAESAARAAQSTARHTAKYAAVTAAESAARYAARYARYTARHTAKYAAVTAARERQNRRLTAMISARKPDHG